MNWEKELNKVVDVGCEVDDDDDEWMIVEVINHDHSN